MSIAELFFNLWFALIGLYLAIELTKIYKAREKILQRMEERDKENIF